MPRPVRVGRSPGGDGRCCSTRGTSRAGLGAPRRWPREPAGGATASGSGGAAPPCRRSGGGRERSVEARRRGRRTRARWHTVRPPWGGLCAIELECAALGVSLRHSSPYHPQTCGKLERLHQTLKRGLRRQAPAATVAELQAQLDWFREYYNTVRPHRGIGRRAPAEAFAARPTAGPSKSGLVIPTHFRVRRDRIDSVGRITLRYNSRLHHIGLGRRHVGVRVLVLVADLDIRVLTNDCTQLRQLTIDPSRDYQPHASQ